MGYLHPPPAFRNTGAMSALEKVGRIVASGTGALLMLVAVLLVIAVVSGLGGCAGTMKPADPLREFAATSDAAAHQTIGPEYQSYVLLDSDLTEEQKQRRLTNLGEWQSATKAALNYLNE